MKKTGLCVLFLLFCFSGYAEPLPFREIRVEVAVAPAFKSIPSWKSEFERRLGYASRIFENQFKIKFKPVRYVDWQPHNEQAEMVELLDDLRNTVPLSDADMVIGLTYVKDLPQGIKDLHTIGQARPLSGHLVIRYPFNRLFKIQEETVLAHELGHAFGAVHTGNRSSIMSPVVEKQTPTLFDEENRQIILQTRTLNFKKGPESLPANLLQFLLRSYLKMATANDSSDFFYSLGLFYLHLGQPEDALKAWKKAVSMNDQNAEMHYNLGALYHKTGKYAEAIKELSRAVSEMNAPIYNALKASALTMLGEAYYIQNNMLAAYSAWTRAAALKPNDLELKTNIALVQMKQGQVMDAEKMLKRVIEMDPRNAKAFTYLGMALNLQGNAKDALTFFEQAVRILGRGAPKNASDLNLQTTLYNELGGIYMKLNRPKEAFDYYQAACQLTPAIDCHRKLGTIFLKAGQYDAASKELALAVQNQKEDAELYGMLGTALAQKGAVPDAVAVFREGLRYAKDTKLQAMMRRNLGNLLVTHRQYEMAETEFRLALAKDWSDPSNHFGLAVALLGQNQLIGAIDSLKNVIRLDPQNERAKTLLTTLETNLNNSKSMGDSL